MLSAGFSICNYSATQKLSIITNTHNNFSLFNRKGDIHHRRKMNNIEIEDENKFTLDYYLSKEQTTEPPFQYRSNYLADAVAEGWRIQRNGGIVVAVSHEGQTLFGKDELARIFNRISELEREQPEREAKELAEQAIRETGKME